LNASNSCCSLYRKGVGIGIGVKVGTGVGVGTGTVTGATCVAIFGVIACLVNRLPRVSHLSCLLSKLHSISVNTPRQQSAGKQLEKVRATRATCKWHAAVTAISTEKQNNLKAEDETTL